MNKIRDHEIMAGKENNARERASDPISSTPRVETPRESLKSATLHDVRVEAHGEFIPERVLEEARQELRSVMMQYTSCVDPTESAARHERVRRAKEQGEVEETVEQMAKQMLKDQRKVGTEERVEPDNARLPATLRLGDQPLGRDDEISNQPGRTSAKKRLRRPPLNRNLGVNTSLAGTSVVKKRRITQVKNSPKRRVGRQTENSKKTDHAIQAAPTATTSNAATQNPPLTIHAIQFLKNNELELSGAGESSDSSAYPGHTETYQPGDILPLGDNEH